MSMARFGWARHSMALSENDENPQLCYGSVPGSVRRRLRQHRPDGLFDILFTAAATVHQHFTNPPFLVL